MKFSDIPVVVDPDLAPGALRMAVVPFITREKAADIAESIRQQVGDALIAEEIMSIGESYPFLIRLETATEPIRCECCGASVTMLGEAEASQSPPRTWRPGIWEAPGDGPWRKHTLRRCNWLLERGTAGQ